MPLLCDSSQMADYVFPLPDHWQDVVAGSLLGIVSAYFAYRQYFHSLASGVSHFPYPPRTQRNEGTHDHPASGLPYYQRLQRPADREGEAEVELAHDTVRRGEHEPGQPEQGWERGPGLESGFPHS